MKMKLYLYDPRYNLKRETTYEKLSEVFGKSKNTLMVSKSKRSKLENKYYIIDDKIKLQEIREIYSKEKLENEVWKVIEGSDNKFLISNYGRFKRIFKNNQNGRFILPYFIKRKNKSNNRDKQFIKCQFRGVYKEYLVSRLVAYHFVEIFYESDGWTRKGKDLKYKKYKFDDLVVYHKNGILYDNYHANLEFLDREDLGKKTGYKSRGGREIIAIDVIKKEVVGSFKSTRHVADNLPVSRQAVSDSLNKIRRTNVVGGRYKFEYEEM